MLQPGQSLDGYILIRLIGSGGFGEVWLCQSETMRDFRALKFVPPSDQERIRKEFDAIQKYRSVAGRLRSPSIMPIEHVNLRDGGLFYIMPLADGFGSGNPDDAAWTPRTLALEIASRKSTTKWFSCDEIQSLLVPVLQALQLLSDAGLVHRDVKPENILFLEGRPCLADLGLAGVDSDNITRRGTPGYSAPSWFVETGGHPDMFGAAATLFTLMTGNPPDKMGRAAFRWPPQGEGSLSNAEKQEWLRMHRVIRRAVDERPLERFLDFRSLSDAIESPVPASPDSPNTRRCAGPFSSESSSQFSASAAPAERVYGRKSCILGFVLGILGLYAWFIPLIGFPVTITGLILSLNGLRSPMIKLATAGTSINAVFLVVTIINSAIGAYMGWSGQLDSFNLF